MTHLNDITKVYLEEVAKKKKDNSYLETDFKKRQANNEKARKDLMKGPQMKNPHFEEKQLDPVGQEDADVDNDGKPNTKTDKYLLNRRKAIGKAISKKNKVKEAYAVKPRFKDDEEREAYIKKVREKSAQKKVNKIRSAMEAKNLHGEVENPNDLKSAVKKAVKRIDTNVSGDVDKKDKSMGDYGEFIPSPDGKKKVVTKIGESAVGDRAKKVVDSQRRGYHGDSDEINDLLKQTQNAVVRAKKSARIPKYGKVTPSMPKESFSNWRNDLREVMGEDGEEKKQVKEKNVKNTIKINPKISEEAIILESVELSEDHEIETLNYAADFFVEQGINEDGLEMVIEELGLEEFVDLVYEVGYETLSEAYALTSKKKTPKKLPKGTAPAKTTKATISRGDRKIKAASPSGAFKRRPAAAKAVETAKKEQPKKKPVRDAIARGIFRAVDAYKAGMERHKKAMGAAKETGKTIAKAAAVTHEAGRRAGQSKAGKAIKKVGSAALKAGAEKVKKDIESLKAKNRVRKEEYNVEETAMQMSPAEVALQKKKAMVDQQIAQKRKQALTKVKKQSDEAVQSEELSIADQMRISREAAAKRKPYQPGDRQKQRAAQMRNAAKNAKKDTRTDAEKMADATGPRPGSRYRGD